MMKSWDLNTMRTIPVCSGIKIDYIKREVVTEFSAKILGEDYPQLISKDTIHKCFQNINRKGIGAFDIDKMIKTAQVVSCDVTKDIPFDDIPQLTTYIRGHLTNYQQYVCQFLRNGNLELRKNVTTKKYKKRLVIYDKEREMNRAENRPFVGTYGDENFIGKCRFEMNLTSKYQIRETLNIQSNDLGTVLRSKENPILSFIQETVGPREGTPRYNNRKTYLVSLVLKDCNYDLAQVEEKMRSFYGRGTDFKKIMKPYREYYDMDYQEDRDILNELLALLK